MNEEDTNAVNVSEEKSSKCDLNNTYSEELLSPRRSIRIQKSKTSDSYNRQELDSNGVVSAKEVLSEKIIKPLSPTSINDNIQTNGEVFQVDNGGESFESMFDDIFEQRYAKSLHSFLPKKLTEDSARERKFFKKNSLESPKLNISNYICNKGNLPTEDVSKVFKIISKPNLLSDIATDSKSATKPLKTYSNKRRNFKKSDVIESFGLPDRPIASQNVQPLVDKELDVAIQDINEITLLDVDYITEPWIITAEGEEFFPVSEEIRIKSEPIHDALKTNGSFLDFSDSFENLIEPVFFSSTPFNSRISDSDKSTCAALNNIPKNPKLVNQNKEIDIEAIKMNFKKMLSRTDILGPQEQIIDKKNCNVSSSKKKNRILSKNSNSSSMNSGILFVEGDSLTVDNKEFEFSNNPLVPKRSHLDISKNKNISKSNPKCIKTTETNFESSVSYEEKAENPQISKKVLRTRKQRILPVNEINEKEKVDDILPKNILETDNLISYSKCNSQSTTVKGKKIKHLVIDSKQYDTNSKRVLRSTLHNPKNCKHTEVKHSCLDIENSTHGTKSECEGSGQEISNDGMKPITKKSEDQSEILRSVNPEADPSGFQIDVDSKIVEKESLGTKVNVPANRILRASTQDSVETREKPLRTCKSTSEICNQKRSKVVCMSTVKIALEKYNFINDGNSSTSDSTLDVATEILQKNKHEKLLLPLAKGKKFAPEIIIILNPLDLSKLNEKSVNSKKLLCGAPSPIKRKLRSTNSIPNQIKSDPNQEESNRHSKDSLPDNNLINTATVTEITVEQSLKINESIDNENPVDTPNAKSAAINEEIFKSPVRKDSQKILLDNKIKKKDLKVEGCKWEKTSTDILQKDKAEILSCVDSTISKSIGITQNFTVELENSHLSKLEAKDRCKKNDDNSITTTTKETDLHNLSPRHKREQILDEKLGILKYKDVIEDTNPSEIKPCNVHLSSIDNTTNLTEVDSLKYMISEKHIESVTQMELKNKSPRKKERKDEHICANVNNVKNQNNLEINSSYTELQKICGQQKDHKNLKIIDNQTLSLLKNANKNVTTEKHSSKIEEIGLSTSLKREEDKVIFAIPVTDKMDSIKYINDNQAKPLHDNIVAPEKITEEQKNSNLPLPNSKTILLNNVISDETKSDSNRGNTCSDNLLQEKEENHNTEVCNVSKTQIINIQEPLDRELENAKIEKGKGDTFQQDTNKVREEQELSAARLDNVILESCNIRLEKDTSTEISSTQINLEQEAFHELAPNSKIENNVYAENENKVDSKTEKMEKRPGFSDRLKEKRRKLLGVKASSAEKDTKKNENKSANKSTLAVPIRKDVKKNEPIPTFNAERVVNKNDNKLITKTSTVCTKEDLKTNENKTIIKQSTFISSKKHKKQNEDTFVNNSNPTVSTGKQIKGHGSKPANKLISSEQVSDYQVNNIRLSQPLTIAKKRGRPRKLDISQQNNVNESIPTFSAERDVKTNENKAVTKQSTAISPKTHTEKNEDTFVNTSTPVSVEKEIKELESKLVNKSIPSEEIADDQIPTAGLSQPITIARKRGRPRKLNVPEASKDRSLQKPTNSNSRGRARRRQSLDDVDLLERSRSRSKACHSDRIKRSKSVAPRIAETRRTLIDRDNSEAEDGTNWTRSRNRKRNSVDDMDLLHHYKEVHTDRAKRSKSVAPRVLKAERKSSDTMKSSINHSNLYATRNWMDGIDLLSRYKLCCNDEIRRNKTNTQSSSENKKKPIMGHTKVAKAVSDISVKSRTLSGCDVPQENAKRNLNPKNEYVEKLSHGPKKDIKDVSHSPKGSKKDDGDFKVGDVAWAQIGSHPFWPCLVTKEPGTRFYKKIFQGKHFVRELFHVRFFGDKGRRAWINKQQIMLYSNREDLAILKEKMKSEDKIVPSAYNVKHKSLQKWKGAVEEAEQLKVKNVKERLLFFVDMFSKGNSPKQKTCATDGNKSNDLQTTPISIKRRSNENTKIEEKMELPLNTESIDESPKKLKKKNLTENAVSQEITESKQEEVEGKSQIQNVEDSSQQNESMLIRSHLRRQMDEISEIGSKTSSDNITDTSSNSMEAQRALYKRNNLFKGISRDRVCQFCYKSGDVLKCRGRCNGVYHISCSLKILEQKSPRKKKENNTSPLVDKNITDNNNKFNVDGESQDRNILHSMEETNCLKEVKDDCAKETSGSGDGVKGTEEDCIKEKKEDSVKGATKDCVQEIKEDCIKETKEEYLREKEEDCVKVIREDCITGITCYNGINHKKDICISLKEEEQVQIITVPSSVYNTPPRKTFPPDFKNMTLAEQIDYKMKEIMRKFETKTFYAESSSESNSEEVSGIKILPQAGHAPLINDSKPDEKKIEEIVTQEIVMENNINTTLNSTEVLTVEKIIQKKLKPFPKKKLFKHVTADSETFIRTDIIQEDKLNTSEDPLDCQKKVDPKNFKCGFCVSDLYPYCFVCHLAISKKGSNIRQKCSIYPCGRFYHPECLKMWPQTQWSLIQTTRHKDSDIDMDSFVCPLHVCHTCVSDDPRAATSRCSGDKIVKCLRCPSTYHSSNLCVPAGTTILSSSQVICPRHREKSKMYTINTTWCFLCSEGGNLICCETCPTSVHPECLPVNLTDDDKFICEDCESGRLPLYDEIVWVKLGKFRWWPALILFPNEIPDNIKNMKHGPGEFVVKFFGTYDYYWVNRGRSFLFQEGDTGQCNSVKKKVDMAFNRAVEEAVVAHKLKKEFKLSQEVESVSSLKPPPYIRIKVNKPVGNVRHLDLDLSSTNACECDPNKPHPCGPESDCLNRLLLTECNPDVCPAGKRCKNQSFEKREYPPLVPYKTQGRGWGLKTLTPIKKGQFVIEYVGELIDSDEYQRRIQKMHEQKEENYYFLTIDKDRMIDAGPKGNAARFMNHCCQPNCETQKWTVNGDTRVGLFATEDIPPDTELTFNYNLECVGKEKKVCRCGAPNCSGFIGVKAKQDTDTKRQKKYVKKKVPVEPVILPPCFVCGEEGLVISCNNKVCNKTYHQHCLKIKAGIEGSKFICPWHNCNICSKRTIRCCVKCINSYCPSHSDGNIRYDNLLGFVCTTHDPMTPPSDVHPVRLKRKKNDVITDETAVTSTTSDDIDDELDWMPLLTRFKLMNSKRSASVESESDSDLSINKSSTPYKKQFLFSDDHESQDEGMVSSATVTDSEENVGVKRKRKRTKKGPQQKKLRLSNEASIGITASSLIDDKLSSHSNPELTSSHNNLENR